MKQHYLKKKNFIATSMLKILQMQITYMQKRVCKDSKIKNFGEYYDMYLKGDTLLLADVFENLQKKKKKHTKKCV